MVWRAVRPSAKRTERVEGGEIAKLVDIGICTRDPRPSLFSTVLGAIAQQTAAGQFSVTVVDNGSVRPIEEEDLYALHSRGIEARIVSEVAPGIARARVRIARETAAPWVLFVDDDNELEPNYVERGLRFIKAHPRTCCMGGRLKLPAGLAPPEWAQPFLPYLGIRDFGPAPIINSVDYWGPWEPPGAGAWVRRDLLQLYAQRLQDAPAASELGRGGRLKLGSCEDSLLMRGATAIGGDAVYNPELILYHHLDPARLSKSYLLELMLAYGPSQVNLEAALGNIDSLSPTYGNANVFGRMVHDIFSGSEGNIHFRIAQVAWHIAARRQFYAVQRADDRW